MQPGHPIFINICCGYHHSLYISQIAVTVCRYINDAKVEALQDAKKDAFPPPNVEAGVGKLRYFDLHIYNLYNGCVYQCTY